MTDQKMTVGKIEQLSNDAPAVGLSAVERVVKCRRFSGEAETDWCLAEAARESLREHMRLLKEAQERIACLESLRMDEIVVGDRRIDNEGNPEGTMLTSPHWDKRMLEAGLDGKWCQIIIRLVGT